MAAPQRRPTIRDVAGAAGVSVGTASHALNGTGRISGSTRSRVHAAAERLRYRPNPRARALRSTTTMALGLLLPVTANRESAGRSLAADFYLELAGAAANAAFASDHGLLLLPSSHDASDLARFPIDGVMLSDPERHDPRLRTLDALGIPTVTLERDLALPDRSWWVAADNQRGARALLDHLLAGGAHSPALLTLDLQWSWIADLEAGYRAWCADGGLEPRVVSLPATAPHDTVEQAVRQLLSQHGVDAIVTPPERIACVAAQTIQSLGLTIPQDVRIAACVDGREARAADITALDLRPDAHAEAAVGLLLGRLGGSPASTRLIDSRLRVRRSSGSA